MFISDSKTHAKVVELTVNGINTALPCCIITNLFTVNFLNIRTPKNFVVITLKLELCGSTIK